MAEGPATKKTSFVSAMRDIVLVLILLGGGTYYWYNHQKTKSAINELRNAAYEKLERDDLDSLKLAEAKFQEILTNFDADNGFALSGLAETYFHEYRHGLDTLPKAKEYLAKAEAENAKTPERYATRAYVQIVSGQAAQAEKELEALFSKDTYHAKLGHAYGWALLEEGNYTKANQALTQAQEGAFSSVRIALTLAEVAHRQGNERGALKFLQTALGQTMNPNHEIALGWDAALRAKTFGSLATPLAEFKKVKDMEDKVGPRAKAYLAWAQGEIALSLNEPQQALEQADAATKLLPDYAPFDGLRARALWAMKKPKDAVAAFEVGMKKKPEYLGLLDDLADLKAEMKDPSTLDLIAEMEKAHPAQGAEYEVRRGEFYLSTNQIKQAQETFTKAADLGDDPRILLGLAKISFAEEKAKGKKADLDKVGEALQQALDAKKVFPEANEFYGEISLWNFQMEPASKAFADAEDQYKKQRRSTPEVLRFYDRVIGEFEGVDDKSIKAEATKQAKVWSEKRNTFLASVKSLSNN